MFYHIAGVLQLVQQRKILQSGSSQSPRGFSVTPPRLRLDDNHLRQIASFTQKFLQTFVTVIQMDPHGDRKAEYHVESCLIKSRQILPQNFARSLLGQKVETLEGQVIRARIALARFLNQHRVQIHAD